jgi:hypothetical protein
MYVPMLEHQAGLFQRTEGIHYNVIEKNIPFYDELETKMREKFQPVSVV